MTDKPKTIFDWLRRLDPMHRIKVAELNDFRHMDDALLIERIRHMSHHTDLIIKYEWRENKGKELVENLTKFLEEHKRRGLENTELTAWAQGLLEKYKKWYAERKPQIKEAEFDKNPEFWKLIISRRSIRKWQDKEVPQELVSKIIGAATWAPSSCNRQAWKFTIVPKEKRKVLQHRLLETAPVVILISIDERPYFFHEKEAPAMDVGFAAQNALLAAAALGIGSCPVFFAYSYVQKAKQELGIEKYRKIYLAIALGYAAEHPDAPARPVVENVMDKKV